MNEISESIIKTAEVIAKNNIQKSGTTKIQLGVISNTKCSEDGKYQVKVYGQQVTVYSISGEYQIGDSVFIVVPDGDFSNKKFILGNAFSDRGEGLTNGDDVKF